MKRISLLNITIWLLICAYSFYLVQWTRVLWAGEAPGTEFPGIQNLTPVAYFEQAQVIPIAIVFLILNLLCLLGLIFMMKRKRWAWILQIVLLCIIIPHDIIIGGIKYFELKSAVLVVAKESYVVEVQDGLSKLSRVELAGKLEGMKSRALVNWVTLLFTASYVLFVMLRKPTRMEFQQ